MIKDSLQLATLKEFRAHSNSLIERRQRSKHAEQRASYPNSAIDSAIRLGIMRKYISCNEVSTVLCHVAYPLIAAKNQCMH